MTENKDNKKDLIQKFTEFLDKAMGTSKVVEENTQEYTPLIKSLDEEQRLAVFVVLEPEKADLQNHIYSAEEIEKACHNYNRHCGKANLFHEVELNDAYPVESYTTPSDIVMNDKVITKGTWVQVWSFEKSALGEELWQGVKAGVINGVSIGCTGSLEEEL